MSTLIEKIKNLAEGTDKLDELKELIAEAEAQETLLTESRTKLEDYDKTVASLRDTNMRLFLQQTTKVEDSNIEEPDLARQADDMFESFSKRGGK